MNIINLVQQFENTHKQLMSTSPRCHAPHFNRDTLTDNIYNIYVALHGTVNIEQIGQLLEKLNKEYANGRLCRPHSVYKQSVIDKCKKHNMWLFIDKSIPFEHVNALLHSDK